MKRPGRRLSVWASYGAFALVLTACDSGPDEAPAPADGAVQGVPREDILNQAEPMTLEEAERLGIVDTTIRLGVPVGADSAVQPGGPAGATGGPTGAQ